MYRWSDTFIHILIIRHNKKKKAYNKRETERKKEEIQELAQDLKY